MAPDLALASQSSMGRRTSARIQKLLEEEEAKRLLNPQEQIQEEEDEGITRRSKKKKKTTTTRRSKENDTPAVPPPPPESSLPPSSPTAEGVATGGAVECDVTPADAPLSSTTSASSASRVRASSDAPPCLGDKALVIDTIRTFNKYYLHFVQEEEKRYAERKLDQESKSKNGSAPEEKIKQPSKRPDLKAITKMNETQTVLNVNKKIGSIPGIDVGHQFFSRAEMVVVGFHSHWLNGIDYIGRTGSKKRKSGLNEYTHYPLPLAIAIVVSGQYEDDLDNCEDVIYTGQGGNDLLGNKRQIADQVMERGNLALKNAIDPGTPVRVIRGHQSRSSYAGKIYTYDGLYKVNEYWAEKGVSGFTVYKFRLKRIPGQPPLTTNQVHYTNGRIPTSVSEIRGLVSEDITGGLEAIPIPATNLVDDPPVPPTDSIYIKNMQVARSVKLPPAGKGCDCKGSCADSRRCACARLNGGDFPYVQKDGGRLIEPKGVVFECGPNCGCGPGCVNRASQRGIRYRLEVFRTPSKGWGVRSWDFIPSGAFVCEYIGVLMRTEETENAHENFYLFDIDCYETMKGLEGREKRLGDVSLPAHLQTNNENISENDPEFCIDGKATGNVTRYINHSCQPNLFVQCVLSSHHDLNQARIVLFAADNIPPLQELSYDYGYRIDSVMDADGKPKNIPCYCGAENCRKRML